VSLLINSSHAQLANPPISQIIKEKYGQTEFLDNQTKLKYTVPASVQVNYESPSTVLISGELINSEHGTFNSKLWQAMDLLKNQYGFKLQNVMTNAVGNPKNVYILMTK